MPGGKFILNILISGTLFLQLAAQDGSEVNSSKPGPGLFGSPEPLALKMKVSLKQLKQNTNDSTYLELVVQYREPASD